jgi:hypothetical protein
MVEEHLKEDISNIQNCAGCHPTGLKEPDDD